MENLIKQLEKLDGTEIVIKADGNYPDKRSTEVQHVAHYQNDGTATIKPAKFVEKAVRAKRGWATPVFKAISKYLDGLEWELDTVGLQISKDINDAVNRIKTGRLKKSFGHKIVTK